jgi:hypothetical protein
MGRKTNLQNSGESLQRAAALAARTINEGLCACNGALLAYLAQAQSESDRFKRASALSSASNLVDAVAKLGNTLVQLKGELRHQHISVERNAGRSVTAPKSARNPKRPKSRKSR